MLNERASGVLLHISSLPSKYGIGCFDKCAYDFVDFLQAAGQTYWQILPLCPTTIGDSPYQSISTFALKEYFIDLDALCRLELLKKEEFEDIEWFKDKNKVDYSLLYTNRHRVLYKAFDRFKRNIPNDFNFVKKIFLGLMIIRFFVLLRIISAQNLFIIGMMILSIVKYLP